MMILCKYTKIDVFFSLASNMSSFWYWQWCKKVLFQYSDAVQLVLGRELHDSVTWLEV